VKLATICVFGFSNHRVAKVSSPFGLKSVASSIGAKTYI